MVGTGCSGLLSHLVTHETQPLASGAPAEELECTRLLFPLKALDLAALNPKS